MPEVDVVVRLNGNHYTLPGGSVWQNFVDALSAELNYFVLGRYPAELCLVFISVVLKRDRMISKGNNNFCLLEKRVKLWQEKFDLLIEGTVQCDHSVHSTHHRSQDSKDRIAGAALVVRLVPFGQTIF